MEIATGIAPRPDDSAMEIALREAAHVTKRGRLNCETGKIPDPIDIDDENGMGLVDDGARHSQRVSGAGNVPG